MNRVCGASELPFYLYLTRYIVTGRVGWPSEPASDRAVCPADRGVACAHEASLRPDRYRRRPRRRHRRQKALRSASGPRSTTRTRPSRSARGADRETDRRPGHRGRDLPRRQRPRRPRRALAVSPPSPVAGPARTRRRRVAGTRSVPPRREGRFRHYRGRVPPLPGWAARQTRMSRSHPRAAHAAAGSGSATAGVRATVSARIRNCIERGKRRPGGGGPWCLSASAEQADDLGAGDRVRPLEVAGEAGQRDRLGRVALGEGAADRGQQVRADALHPRVERGRSGPAAGRRRPGPRRPGRARSGRRRSRRSPRGRDRPRARSAGGQAAELTGCPVGRVAGPDDLPGRHQAEQRHQVGRVPPGGVDEQVRVTSGISRQSQARSLTARVGEDQVGARVALGQLQRVAAERRDAAAGVDQDRDAALVGEGDQLARPPARAGRTARRAGAA